MDGALKLQITYSKSLGSGFSYYSKLNPNFLMEIIFNDIILDRLYYFRKLTSDCVFTIETEIYKPLEFAINMKIDKKYSFCSYEVSLNKM